MTALQLVVLSLAAYRLTRLVTRDSITAGTRERLEVYLEGLRLTPARLGRWARRRDRAGAFAAELLLCSWCLSVWVAGAVVAAFTAWPGSRPLEVAVQVLAVSAVGGLLLDRDRS